MLKILLLVLGILGMSVVVLPPMFSDYIIGAYVPPLQLPLSNEPSTAGTSTLDGVLTVGSGSVVGFRVPESFLLQRGTLVGRTPQ